MKDYLLLMHSDAPRFGTPEEWDAYFEKLQSAGRFESGSEIGTGECLKKSGSAGPLHKALVGYITILAKDIEDAKTFVPGNPVYEAGGTVEVRELPKS